MKTYFISSAVIVLAAVIQVSCNQRRQPSSGERPVPGPVYISGRIEGTGPEKDSIRIYFGGEIPFNRKVGVYTSVITTDHRGHFQFKSPVIDKPQRITLFTYPDRAGEKSARFGDALRNYLVEPGDSIYMVVDHGQEDTSFTFSGNGAQKFSCRWAADRKGYELNRRAIQEKYGARFGDLLTKVGIADSIIAVQLGVLDQYGKHLDADIYGLMKADIIGNTSSKLKTFWHHLPENIGKEEQKLFRSLVKEAQNTDLGENIRAGSPYYIQFLSLLGIARLILENPGQDDYRYRNIYAREFDELCAIWRNEYTGLLREKLLLYNLQNVKVQDTYGLDVCLKESYELVRTPALKKIMEDWYGKKTRGAKAYDFALPDTAGRTIRLSDFRDKVVYLDIWFTGCTGCITLAREVDDQVYPEFRNNPEVVFISVSMDRSKEQWLNSVESEKYGLKAYVNLYTDGMGLDHPFIKYYNIQGGPTTMLIDRQGRIYSFAPPKHGKVPELVSLIKEALKHK